MDSGYGRVPLHNIPFSEFRYQISRRLLLGGAKSGPVSCIPTLVSCQYPASVLPIPLLHNFVNSISTVILHFALTCTIDLAEGVGCLGVVFLSFEDGASRYISWRNGIGREQRANRLGRGCTSGSTCSIKCVLRIV